MIRLRLKAGREKSVIRRHPWVFASAVAGMDGAPEDGDTVEVCSSRGDFLAWGAVSSGKSDVGATYSNDPDSELLAAA